MIDGINNRGPNRMPLTILQLLNTAARRLVPLPNVPGLRDPLAAIVEIITANPELLQSRLLARIVAGICTDSGSFSESDSYLLDQRAMALVTALSEDWRQGQYTRNEWQAAIAAFGAINCNDV